MTTTHTHRAIALATLKASVVAYPMPTLSPLESEFATTEEAEAHDRWFRTKVAAAIASQGPMIPHAEVMTTMKALIKSKRNAASDMGS